MKPRRFFIPLLVVAFLVSSIFIIPALSDVGAYDYIAPEYIYPAACCDVLLDEYAPEPYADEPDELVEEEEIDWATVDWTTVPFSIRYEKAKALGFMQYGSGIDSLMHPYVRHMFENEIPCWEENERRFAPRDFCLSVDISTLCTSGRWSMAYRWPCGTVPLQHPINRLILAECLERMERSVRDEFPESFNRGRCYVTEILALPQFQYSEYRYEFLYRMENN